MAAKNPAAIALLSVLIICGCTSRSPSSTVPNPPIPDPHVIILTSADIGQPYSVAFMSTPKHWRVSCPNNAKTCLPPNFAVQSKNGNLWLSSRKATVAGTFRFSIVAW